MVAHTQAQNGIECLIGKIEMFPRHLFEFTGAVSPAIGDVTRIRVDSEIIIAKERIIPAAAANFENSSRNKLLDFLPE